MASRYLQPHGVPQKGLDGSSVAGNNSIQSSHRQARPSQCLITKSSRPSSWQTVVRTSGDTSVLGRRPDADQSTVNEARAFRIVEIMNDFQSLQHRIAEYAPNPPPEEYFGEGYQILRQCRAEAAAVLAAPFPLDLSQVGSGDGEQEKRQLQRYVAYYSPTSSFVDTIQDHPRRQRTQVPNEEDLSPCRRCG